MGQRIHGALGFTLAIALALSVGSAGAAEKIKFTQAWIPQGDVAWLWAAKVKGFWERRGLDVSIDRGYGSAEAVKQVALGNYDYTAADFGSMIVARSRGLDLINVGIIHHVSPKGIGSLKGKGITRPKDLEGKRVATSAASSVTLLWPAFARASGIDASRVQIILVDPQLHTPTLLEGKTDAVLTYYNAIAPALWARGLDMDYIPFAARGLPTYEYGIITTGARVKRNPDQVRRFVEGALEGLAFSYLNPEETVRLYIEAVKEFKGSQTNKEIVTHGVGINSALGLAPIAEEKGLGVMDPQMVKQTRDLVVKYMNLPAESSLEEIYTNAFVGSVKLTPAQWRQVKEGLKRYILW